MLADVDKLPHGPECEIHEIHVSDGTRSRVQYLVRRSIIDVIRDLVGNRALHGHFKYTPVKLYTSKRRGNRVYSEMWTANWWWDEQMKLRHKGAVTIVPLILATDQTMLSIMCGGQAAYPVYLTLGNINKHWRRKPSKRTMVLLGYLPVEAFEDVEDDDERRRMKADLIHRSMEKMLEPLKKASEEGVDMWCPDGRLRRVYPRIAAYLADWPEQNLMSCTSIGSCPVCSTKRAGRGDIDKQAPLRNREETLGVILSYFKTHDVRELQGLSLKPVWPWWGDLLHVNLATCITPDLLHQLYQGIFKSHLVRWLKYLVGADELDERFAAMPQAEGLKHFPKGISVVKQWTGRESKEMVAQVLPVFLGDVTPELTQLLRSIVDFIFHAHASSMTDTDLADMERDLELFHELKGLLVIRGFYESDSWFDLIPKLHMLSHYAHSIRALGTPDGYNTEAPEHLHIEYAKEPWRASNKVRPLEQMLKYIQQQEAIRMHCAHLNLHLGLGPADEDDTDNVPGEVETDGEGSVGEHEACRGAAHPRRHMGVNPTKRNVLIKDVEKEYGATDLRSAITKFLTNRLDVPEHDVMLSRSNQLNVWHRLYLHHQPLPFAPFEPPRRDVVRASPPTLGPRGRKKKPGVWDTALYLERPNRFGYRAGRVRAFFTLPGHLRHHYGGQLAYLEVFDAFDTAPSSFSRMHSTKPAFDSRNRRRTIVVPITEIVMACHLAPKFNLTGSEVKLNCHTDALAVSPNFWFNHYYSHHIFLLVQHWWRRRPGLLDRLAQHIRRAHVQITGL
ncbi:hypothetical protein BDV93DRAFT_574950 [Ceratobasidium sp. AG-I]|nr:hypothetical protein BDV93DRAFT_574950 [Ceratobasidium sp. AG-I]